MLIKSEIYSAFQILSTFFRRGITLTNVENGACDSCAFILQRIIAAL